MKAPEFKDQLDLFTGEPAMSGVTVGTVTYEGTTYEVDWPYRINDETVREAYGVLYQDGALVGDFINQNWRPGREYTGFSNAEEVIAHAKRFLQAGGAR